MRKNEKAAQAARQKRLKREAKAKADAARKKPHLLKALIAMTIFSS